MQVTEIEEKDAKMWGEIDEFVKQCNAQGEQYEFTAVDTQGNEFAVFRHYQNSTGYSKMEYGFVSHELFLEDELTEKDNMRGLPYAKDIPYLRNVPIRNIRFFISGRAKKTLNMRFLMGDEKLDLDKFIDEYNSMEENTADEETINLAVERKKLINEIGQLNTYTYGADNEKGLLTKIADAVKDRFQINTPLYHQPVTDEYISNMSLQELWELRKTTIEKLKRLNEKLIAVEKRFYEKLGETTYHYGIRNIEEEDWRV